MAIGKGELMQDCFPKHLRMGTPRWKYDNEIQGGKKRGGHKKNKSDGLSLPNQNTIINIICILFYNICKKYNEIQLTKIKIDLKN